MIDKFLGYGAEDGVCVSLTGTHRFTVMVVPLLHLQQASPALSQSASLGHSIHV